jgi:hypothetical protein
MVADGDALYISIFTSFQLYSDIGTCQEKPELTLLRVPGTVYATINNRFSICL